VRANGAQERAPVRRHSSTRERKCSDIHHFWVFIL
jgi:hypothetical protein